MEVNILSIAGILLAAEKRPATDKPQKAAIIYLEEMLVSHHESIFGISGKLYNNIFFSKMLFEKWFLIEQMMGDAQIR